jgi:adenosylcobinamide kinase/adenosylcobinamide-phosphate guanylyltransferase
MIALITGGARSGKTGHALASAGTAEQRTYIATADLLDDEMRERAARHRQERGDRWHTIEEPYEVAECVLSLRGTVVIDCLTLWLSNWMLREELRVDAQVGKLCAALERASADVFAITNEVGSSVVPGNPLGRRFRDLSGLMNQRVATLADRVDLMVCGIPLRVK